MPEELWGVTQVAEALGLSRQRVLQMIDEGDKLPPAPFVCGGRSLWRPNQIQWMVRRQ